MLKQRIATAVVLVAFFLAALFGLYPRGWTAACALVMAIGAWEWAGFARHTSGARIAYAAVMTVAGVLAAVVMKLDRGAPGALELFAVYGLAAAFWVIAVPLWLRAWPTTPSPGVVLLMGWLVLVPAFFALLELRNVHPITLLAFMMLVWIADIAAYFAGRAFGRRKLSPHISPGKTWEGVLGALVATSVYAVAWVTFERQHTPAIIRDLPWSWAWMIGLALALTAFSILGDLFESLMKRQAGLKDSGRILPGHGGVLDRIDALTAALPIAALVTML